MENGKKNAFNSMKWSAIERLFSQAVQLAIMLILARLLGPHAFGIIGMLAIFITIGQVFIDSGFSSALIRKVDRSENDYSTAFFSNLLISLALYVIIYFSAPFISDFYREPQVISVLRVLGLVLVINSLVIVPRTILSVRMDFKSQAKASFSSVIVGGAIALIMAKMGYGVWALVIQTLTTNLLNSIFLILLSSWTPKLTFEIDSFRYLFRFGSKLLISGLLEAGYNNFYQVIIGKKYDMGTVGQFSQANQLSSIPAMTFTNIIQRVTYPIFSHIQNEKKRLEASYLKTLSLAASFIFPLMAGLAAIASPLVSLLLGPSWQNTASLVTILALAFMLYPIHAINLNILQVKGRSDLFLKLEIIKKTIGIVTLIITSQYSVMCMAFGILINSYLSLVINMYYSGVLIEVGIYKQIKEMLPTWFIAISSNYLSWLSATWITNDLTLQLIMMVSFSILLYVSMMFVFNRQIVNLIFSEISKNKEIVK